MTRLWMTLGLVFCSVTNLDASPITYTLAITASGTLGAFSFIDSLVTVTLAGDTANAGVGPSPLTSALVNTGLATVNVAGIGTGTFTDQTFLISSLNDAALTGTFGGPVLLFLDNTTGTGIVAQLGSAFSSYNLASSHGPLSGTGGVASGSHVTPIFPTTAGDLTWTVGQSFSTSTFTATITPEPSTALLFNSAIVGLLVWRGFRLRKSRGKQYRVC